MKPCVACAWADVLSPLPLVCMLFYQTITVVSAVPYAKAVYGDFVRTQEQRQPLRHKVRKLHASDPSGGVKRCRCLTCADPCAARENPNVEISALARLASLFCPIAAELLCCLLLTEFRHVRRGSPHLRTCHQTARLSLLRHQPDRFNTSSQGLNSSRYSQPQLRKAEMFDNSTRLQRS